MRKAERSNLDGFFSFIRVGKNTRRRRNERPGCPKKTPSA
jgi:hypothetical protein